MVVTKLGIEHMQFCYVMLGVYIRVLIPEFWGLKHSLLDLTFELLRLVSQIRSIFLIGYC